MNVHQAKTHLSRLLERVAAGEEIIIAKAGKPVARLVPIEPGRPKRVFGDLKGKVWISPDFDKPDLELQKAFEESRIFPSGDQENV